MLALVSFTSTVYPSLIGTRPPSRLILSKHKDTRPRAHISTGPTSTHTSSGIRGTSGGAHPMRGQTFPGEHQRNHRRGFKQSATANTNTHAYTHTHTHACAPLDSGGKGRIRWSGGNKERLFAAQLEGIAALKVNSPSTRADFHRRRSLVHTSSCIFPAWQGPRPTGRHRERSWLAVEQFHYDKVKPSGFEQASTTPCMQNGKLSALGLCKQSISLISVQCEGKCVLIFKFSKEKNCTFVVRRWWYRQVKD